MKILILFLAFIVTFVFSMLTGSGYWYTATALVYTLYWYELGIENGKKSR